jgi:hypothetical protein
VEERHCGAIAVQVGISGLRGPVASRAEPVATPFQHAKIVVVGMILHHQHDDVLDLRKLITAWRNVGGYDFPVEGCLVTANPTPGQRTIQLCQHGATIAHVDHAAEHPP